MTIGVLLLVAAALGTSVATERHLGRFGATCAAPAVPLPPGARGTGVAWPRPKGRRLSVVIDVGCRGTLDVLRGLGEFQRLHRDVEVEVLMIDPGAFRRVPKPWAAEVLEASGHLTWSPLRMAAIAARRVPLVRLADRDGHVVVAEGAPNLDAVWDALR